MLIPIILSEKMQKVEIVNFLRTYVNKSLVQNTYVPVYMYTCRLVCVCV